MERNTSEKFTSSKINLSNFKEKLFLKTYLVVVSPADMS